MASLNNEGPKKWRIQFMDVVDNKARRQIRFSGQTKKQAETIFHIIERLIEAATLNIPAQPQDAAWLAALPDKFYSRLAKHNLAEPRVIEEPEPEEGGTLRSFVGAFISRRKTLKNDPASIETVKKWSGTFDLLLQCFDEEKPIAEFTLADARDFRSWMEKREIRKSKRNPSGRMAENSMRQRMRIARRFSRTLRVKN